MLKPKKQSINAFDLSDVIRLYLRLKYFLSSVFKSPYGRKWYIIDINIVMFYRSGKNIAIDAIFLYY